jgi:hypothetical protein
MFTHPDFFVAHVFNPQQVKDLRRAVARAFRGTGWTPYYADLDITEGHLLSKVRGVIELTQFGLYEISLPNPNVYLELGLAIGMNRTAYLMTAAGATVPSDLAGLDRLEYDAYSDLSVKLKQMVVSREKEKVERVLEHQRLRHRVYDNEVDSIAPRAVAFFSAVRMHHKFGREISDADAIGGTAWESSLLHAQNHILYGPYEPLKAAGRYVAYFRLKLKNAPPVLTPALCIDVFGASHAERHIFAAEWKQVNSYQWFGVDFEYSGTGNLEYRVYNTSRVGELCIDSVAVVPFGNA